MSAPLFFPVPWRRQPQSPVPSNKSNALARGLVRAWDHGVRGGYEAAAVGKRLAFQSSSVFSPAVGGIRSTTAPVTSGGVSGTDCGPIHELESLSAYTVYSLAVPDGLAVRQCLWSNGGTMGLGCGYTTSSRVFSEPIADGGFQTEGVTGFFADGVEIGVGFTYDNAITAGRCLVYKNGVLALQSNPSSTGNTNASLGTFSVGGTGSSQFYTWKGLIRLTLVWNRALTAEEHLAVARNPWQLLEDNWLILPLDESTGGTTATVTSAGAIASAEAFGTATVTHKQAVSCTGIASAEAFGSPTLSLHAAVSPGGIASAEALGVPIATHKHAIVCTGIASAGAFGNAVVTSDLVAAGGRRQGKLSIGLSIGF